MPYSFYGGKLLYDVKRAAYWWPCCIDLCDLSHQGHTSVFLGERFVKAHSGLRG